MKAWGTPNNAIDGSFNISSPLVNHGVVDPWHPTTDGHTMTLQCEPKVGAGDWKVTGGTSGSPNTMVIDTPIAGAGDLVVGSNGVLEVHRHFSLYGNATISALATINVDREIMFDVGVFAMVGCPQ